ncbi:MAG TPA: M20/M25/M40 family metallo-hydrolase, partial [Planctomycetota bacterium]|nr:M20/M25/M40 family metallo-hydrolase [Planctomycetota bacterium]
LTAIEALKAQGGKHARCVVLIEGCEESGSYDLPYYIDHLKDRIGSPDLVICLDSGCGNYDQLWCTTSLRGLVSGDLSIEVLREGVHSGDASGIVASSFRILRVLLERLDSMETGAVRPEFLKVKIPDQRIAQAEVAARVLGDAVTSKFPWIPGMTPMTSDLKEAVLNRTWRPALSITGIDGLPKLENAGNVLRPATTVKISMRIPPMVDAKAATVAMKELLESNPPYGAKVTFRPEQGAAGWNAPPLEAWLSDAVDRASRTYFGRESVWMGEGGTIPFMGMLGEKFPRAQFMITGVLGPQSNAHGPNEFLHLPTGMKLTSCVAQVLGDHYKHAKAAKG